MATRSTAEWMAALEPAGVPAVPLRSLEDLLEDEHLQATGFWGMADHPTEGRLRLPNPATRFFATPADVRRLAPRLGEHTREVLAEAGLAQRDRRADRRRGGPPALRMLAGRLRSGACQSRRAEILAMRGGGS